MDKKKILIWAVDCVILATPTIFPTIPIRVASFLYLIALGIFLWLFINIFYLKVTNRTIKQWEIIVAYVIPILIFSLCFGFYFSHKRETPINKLKKIYTVNYFNETVSVDGKLFIQCSFTNVTFKWKGDAFMFQSSSFEGENKILISNFPDATNTVRFIRALYPQIAEILKDEIREE
jgi:hypothetical protein